MKRMFILICFDFKAHENRYILTPVRMLSENMRKYPAFAGIYFTSPDCTILKGEVSRTFAVTSKPSRNNEIVVKFVKNYHPSAIKLSISASGQRQGRPVWIET